MRKSVVGAAIGSAVVIAGVQLASASDPRNRVPDSIARPSDDIEPGFVIEPPLELFDGRLSGDLNIDLGFSDDNRNPFSDRESDAFLTADVSALFELTDSASIIGDVSLFSNADKQTLSLVDEPAIELNELYIFVDVVEDELAVFGGKLEPEFEISFDQADGVLDIGFRNDLEFGSVLGVGAEYYFEVLDYEHKVSAVAYMADRTFLSQTVINNTPRLTEDEGGLANTDAPESVVFRLAGDLETFDYVVALRRQEDAVSRVESEDDDEDADRSRDETAALVGFGATLIDDDDLGVLRLLGEASWLENFGGEPEDAFFWSLGATFEYDRVLFGASYVQRDVDGSEIDTFTVVSGEYDLGHGFYVGADVARFREEREVRAAWGVQVSYRLAF